MNIFPEHQQKQVKIIDDIEHQALADSLKFSIVEPVSDFDKDSRICLTSVHFPNRHLIKKIQQELQEPLKVISPNQYYYRPASLHITIKNIRVINDPPHFTNRDIKKAQEVFASVIPNQHAFNAYFYRLLLMPTSLMLVGTTDPELDTLILDLDKKLRDAGIPDDKQYANEKYFFCNMTLARFTHPISKEFKSTVKKISDKFVFDPYRIDSVSLIASNASLVKCKTIGEWKLSSE